MARVQAQLEVDEASWQEADKMLAQLEQTVRGPAIGTAMRQVLQPLKQKTKQILPKPGYPGDKPELKPLRETLGIRTRNYQDNQIKVAILGYQYPAGAHGHLLEGGHDLVKGGSKKSGGVVVGYVQPYEYLITTVNESREQNGRELVAALTRILAKNG